MKIFKPIRKAPEGTPSMEKQCHIPAPVSLAACLLP